MSSSWFSRQPRLLAQNTENSASSPVTASTGSQTFGGQLWMISTISLLIILSIVVAYGQWQLKQSKKALKFEIACDEKVSSLLFFILSFLDISKSIEGYFFK